MTNKDHEKLESFHLTEAEKKALRDQYRADMVGEILFILSVIASAAAGIFIIMEIATR